MRKIIISIAVLANLAFGENMFIYNVKTDLIDPVAKEKVGEIYEGTPIKVIKQVGELSLIEVKGEVVDLNATALAHKKDPLVTFLDLKKPNDKTTLEFLVNTKDLTKSEYASWEEIELVYYDTCSSCHAAHKPKEHLMNEWDAYLSAMQYFAKINDVEKGRILRFLQAYAKDGIAKEEE